MIDAIGMLIHAGPTPDEGGLIKKKWFSGGNMMNHQLVIYYSNI